MHVNAAGFGWTDSWDGEFRSLKLSHPIQKTKECLHPLPSSKEIACASIVIPVVVELEDSLRGLDDSIQFLLFKVDIMA